MGPCRFYKRDRNAFYTFEEEGNISDQDQEAAGQEEQPPPPPRPPPPPPPPAETKERFDPVTEEIKGALRYINPKYQEEEIQKILSYALKSENIMRIIFSCARQYGYTAKIGKKIDARLSADASCNK